MEVIIASLITAIATFFSVYVGKKCLPRKSSCPVKSDTDRSANVYKALRYTMQNMEADRCYILEFHNGGHYYSGRGQQKFSCTHEMVEEGISRECIKSQEHRVSNYFDYINTLITNKQFKYEKINDMKDSSFLMLLNRSGVKSIYNVPIKTLDGKLIGILGIDYVKNEAVQFTDQDFEFLKKQSRIIAGYLI